MNDTSLYTGRVYAIAVLQDTIFDTLDSIDTNDIIDDVMVVPSQNSLSVSRNANYTKVFLLIITIDSIIGLLLSSMIISQDIPLTLIKVITSQSYI